MCVFIQSNQSKTCIAPFHEFKGKMISKTVIINVLKYDNNSSTSLRPTKSKYLNKAKKHFIKHFPVSITLFLTVTGPPMTSTQNFYTSRTPRLQTSTLSCPLPLPPLWTSTLRQISQP